MAPLDGVKIVEFGGIGPGPFAAMLLADLGASVVRVQRAGAQSPVALAGSGADRRGRRGVTLDLKAAAGRDVALRLIEGGDALLEGYRPGVMERLGLGPDVALARNPRLVYGRMTGYGQTGPMAATAGHDINYVAMSGVLGAIARTGERPLAPLNLLGDYGGGGMLLALGVVSALLEAQRTGAGQVVDAAMVDGVAQLATVFFGFERAGAWGEAGTNVLDSGAPFYEVYETSDGRHVAVGAIEPPFYTDLLRVLGVEPTDAPQWDRARWPELKDRFAAIFRGRSRDEWSARAEGTSACLTPVLSLAEAHEHPHHVARSTFVERAAGLLPAAAPRFSGSCGTPPPEPDAESVLKQFGLPADDVDALRRSGALGADT